MIHTIKDLKPVSKKIRAGRNDSMKDLLFQHRPKTGCVSHPLTYDYVHRNYMDYLSNAWADHLGVIVTPDIIWYMGLCGVTEIVAKAPHLYRELFTTSDQKKELVVESSSLTEMPLDALMEELKKNVPTDTKTFLPNFTTSNKSTIFARYAAFADMASPFYSYGMMLCGIPAVDVQGDVSDWTMMAQNWKKISKLFNSSLYFQRVQVTLDNIVENLDNKEHWQKMFWLEPCGSGSQTECFGWINDLFEDNKPRYTHNYPTNISTVSYKQLQTGKEYEMKQGLLGSNRDGEFLKPCFDYMIYEKAK